MPVLLKIEAVAEDHFGDEMVGRVRNADAKAEIDFPARIHVKVDSGENLVLLLAGGKKVRGGTERAIVFKPGADFPGQVVAELEVGREDEAPAGAFAVERFVERGIEGQIPAVDRSAYP